MEGEVVYIGQVLGLGGFRGLRSRSDGSGREVGEDGAWQQFSETENVRRLTGYIAAIVIRWGIKRTPNAMKLGRRPTYTTTTPLVNFQPIPRKFFGHL